VITSDNVTVKVNAVVYFRVVDPRRAIVEVENYLYATSQLAQTTLRSVLGEVGLDDLLSKREKLNQRLQEILDTNTDPWGIKVALVEIKGVDLPENMQRAMARQAEAERSEERRVGKEWRSGWGPKHSKKKKTSRQGRQRSSRAREAAAGGDGGRQGV